MRLQLIAAVAGSALIGASTLVLADDTTTTTTTTTNAQPAPGVTVGVSIGGGQTTEGCTTQNTTHTNDDTGDSVSRTRTTCN